MNFLKNMKIGMSDNLISIKVIDDLLKVITEQRENQNLCLLLIDNVFDLINKISNTGTEENLKKIKNYWFIYLCYEISIIAFYLKKKRMGGRVCEKILFFNGKLNIKGNDLLARIKQRTISNFQFYNPLVIERRYSLEYEAPFLDHPKPKFMKQRYYKTNPSIITTENGYRIILRTLNYSQVRGAYHKSMETKITLLTKNYLIDVDQKFNIISVGKILDDPKRKKFQNFYASGLEDCRLIQSESQKDEIMFFCADCETLPIKTPQNCICKAKKNLKGDYDVFYHQKMTGVKGNTSEKNWLPFSDQVLNQKIKFIYGSNPMIIGKYDMLKRDSLFQTMSTSGYDNGRMRGSSPIIKFKYKRKEGYLYVVHEVLFSKNSYDRHYFHRFVLLDSNNSIINVSDLFFFDHIGVEFCVGLCNSHTKDEVIISYGYEDCEAKFVGVKLETIFNMLNKVIDV